MAVKLMSDQARSIQPPCFHSSAAVADLRMGLWGGVGGAGRGGGGPPSGVARVLGARGQNTLMAPPPPPPLQFGQIRLLTWIRGGSPCVWPSQGRIQYLCAGGKSWRGGTRQPPASGIWGGAPAAVQLSHF